MNRSDELFLRRAIELAHSSRQNGERPFGAVLVVGDQIVAESGDGCRTLSDPTAHAELRVISDYCQASKLIHLDGYTLYSVAEPCVMCSGAIKWAGISRVVFSVPQSMLQTVSGGIPKPSCASLVNSGGRHIEVCGPYLLHEGLAVYEGFDFAQHRRQLLRAQRD